MSKKTIAEINSLYIEAIKIHARMQAMDSENINYQDTYYILHAELQAKLSEILHENFVLFSKPRLLKFLSLCSTYRPMEPHNVLTRIAMKFEELYP